LNEPIREYLLTYFYRDESGVRQGWTWLENENDLRERARCLQENNEQLWICNALRITGLEKIDLSTK